MPDAPLVIVNPAAGNGRARRLLGWIRERLERRPDARLRITGRPGDAEAWAADALGQHDRVVAVGGDGTIQEIVNGLLATQTGGSLGVVPVGSGNDLARSLSLPGDPAEAWTAALGRVVVSVDVLHARGASGMERWFASAGGIGFDAQVAHAMVRRRGWQRGRAGYLVTALAELRHFPNRAVRIVIDDEEPFERRILLVAITNGAYYGGGMHIAPNARVDDAWMDLCVVGDIGRLDALRQLPNLYRGRHGDHPAVEMRRARRVSIDGDPETLVHLDGEPFDGFPLRVEMHAGVLSVAMSLR
ncbi:MAG TPA: diacylglycerol kinase family protein [Candidatus Angelobacter sp.]|nr:diacylglycerol kinase family protein [Candidatus Angelobacter sp.]